MEFLTSFTQPTKWKHNRWLGAGVNDVGTWIGWLSRECVGLVTVLRVNLNIDGSPTVSQSHTHLPITIANFSFINLVSIFRCSSPPINPVYPTCVDPSDLLFLLSSHRLLRLPLFEKYYVRSHILTFKLSSLVTHIFLFVSPLWRGSWNDGSRRCKWCETTRVVTLCSEFTDHYTCSLVLKLVPGIVSGTKRDCTYTVHSCSLHNCTCSVVSLLQVWRTREENIGLH
jgi:hypothetical protein